MKDTLQSILLGTCIMLVTSVFFKGSQAECYIAFLLGNIYYEVYNIKK